MTEALDTAGADEIQDTSEWIRRCQARMSELNPVLVHGQLSAISEDMSRRTHWRRMRPELAAEQSLDPPEVRQPRVPEGTIDLTSSPSSAA